MKYDEQRKKEQLKNTDIYNEVLSHLKQELGVLQRQSAAYVTGSYELKHYLLRIKSNKILTEKIKGVM